MQGKRNGSRIALVVLMLAAVLMMTQCAAPATPAPAAVPTAAAQAASTSPTEVSAAVTTSKSAPGIKFAEIIPGPVNDADYNMLGYQATIDISNTYGIEAQYSENVAVADAERVAQEYIGRGFNVIAFHGGQFTTAVTDLAPQYPKVTFIAETGGPDPTMSKPNIWSVGRRVYMGQYPYGVLAAKMSKTKKVGFLGGQKFSNFVSSINTIDQAIAATYPSVKLIYTFTGDQNDTVKGREGAQSLIDQGADFLFLDLNNGDFGAVQAIKASKTPVFFSALYTDKSALAPGQFTSAPVYNFTQVFSYIIDQVVAGHTTGYYDMKPGNGIELSPFYNTPQTIQDATKAAWAQVAGGQLNLVEDTSGIKIPPVIIPEPASRDLA